ncbi:MAG: hypothetical protein OEX04_06080 [Acidimicrobiia bacterium]|nr:hypothetical protein [Acidimicrobiia bacterium]MDH4307029.1 hypothetical protein [Acidimicrobiia bacterium]MDH5293206.1 hypothetical protein [Acidimicrobiia bacterium]
MVEIDPAVVARLDRDDSVDVIVTFTELPDEFASVAVKHVFPAIGAAALRIDRSAFERLRVDPSVVRVEFDGEVTI